MMKYLFIAPVLLALTACSEAPQKAFFNRGQPESLLNVSSEVVSLTLSSERSIDEITNWINQDQPTRAELLCMEGDPQCRAAEEVLGLYGVDYEYMPTEDNTLHLIYERVLARDCEHRFIDNHVNPYKMNHPAFGCSVASNMIQMVSDKRQFVSPALLDYQDAEKTVKSYDEQYINLDRAKVFKALEARFNSEEISFGN